MNAKKGFEKPTDHFEDLSVSGIVILSRNNLEAERQIFMLFIVAGYCCVVYIKACLDSWLILFVFIAKWRKNSQYWLSLANEVTKKEETDQFLSWNIFLSILQYYEQHI